MRKIILFLVTIFLFLGCSNTKTRTEVIDTLIDAGYSKNAAGVYEKSDDDLALRFKYYESPKGYSESGYRYFEEGPVLIMDRGTYHFNYHFNEDLMFYPTHCSLEDGKTGSTEIVYRFETSEFIVTHDDCSLETTDEYVNEFYVQASEYKQQALEIIDNLGLTVDDLNNLKVK